MTVKTYTVKRRILRRWFVAICNDCDGEIHTDSRESRTAWVRLHRDGVHGVAP